MIPTKAVVINHRIMHAGIAKDSSKSHIALTDASLARAIDYPSREGLFAGREGLSKEITKDDISLERMKNIIDYSSRTGKFYNRAEDIPLTLGDKSGGCFGQDGILDDRKLAQKIKSSGSNVVRSVVSIPREYAGELNMESKTSWERMMRGVWREHVEAWGIIDHQNIQWAAWMHVDNPINIHVHILTWDSSGSFTGRQEIPHRAITPSNEAVRKEIFRDKVLEKDISKHYLRELAIRKMRVELGQELLKREKIKLEELRINSIFSKKQPVQLVKESDFTTNTIKNHAEKFIDSLPKSNLGYVQVGSLPKQARYRLDLCYEALKENSTGLRTLEALYKEQVKLGASIKGLAGKNQEDFIKHEMNDFKRRIENVLSKHLARENTPFRHNVQLKTMLEQLKISVSEKNIYLSQENQNRLITQNTEDPLALKISKQVLFNNDIGQKVEVLKEKTLNYCKQQALLEGKSITEKDLSNLSKRIDFYIAKEIQTPAYKSAEKTFLNVVKRQNEKKLKQTISLNPIKTAFNQKELSEINILIKTLNQSCTRNQQGLILNMNHSAQKVLHSARNIVLNNEKVANSIKKEAILFSRVKQIPFDTALQSVINQKSHATDRLLLSHLPSINHPIKNEFSALGSWIELITISSSIKGVEEEDKRRQRALFIQPTHERKDLKRK